MTSSGLLPPGRHAADLDEVHARFVAEAPFPERRAHLWRVFLAFVDCVEVSLPGATLWINGGFVTHKASAAPTDVDVLVLADDGTIRAADPLELYGLLTLREVGWVPEFGKYVQVPKLRAFGGRIDAFVAPRGVPEATAKWEHDWSLVTGPDGQIIEGETKGYVEVQL